MEAEDAALNENEPQLATADPPGGFLKEELLLSAKVERDDIYARQQGTVLTSTQGSEAVHSELTSQSNLDTLIVWTEPSTSLDIALSFQDADGCEDVWRFICDVQRHYAGLAQGQLWSAVHCVRAIS